MALQHNVSFMIIIERRIIIIIKTRADLSQSMKSSIRESIQSVIFPRVSLTRRLVRFAACVPRENSTVASESARQSHPTKERKKDEPRMVHTRESRKVEISRAHPAFFPRGSR